MKTGKLLKNTVYTFSKNLIFTQAFNTDFLEPPKIFYESSYPLKAIYPYSSGVVCIAEETKAILNISSTVTE